MILAALFVSSLFVDYRAVVRDLWSSVAPLSLPDSTVDPGPFAPWISARIKTVDGRSRAIGIELSRTSAFPKSAAEIEAALAVPRPLVRRPACAERARDRLRPLRALRREGRVPGSRHAAGARARERRLGRPHRRRAARRQAAAARARALTGLAGARNI